MQQLTLQQPDSWHWWSVFCVPAGQVGEDDAEEIIEKQAKQKQNEQLYQVLPSPSEFEKRLVWEELERKAKELERLTQNIAK